MIDKRTNSADTTVLICLPLLWKLFTGILADEIYGYLEKRNVIARGTKGI